MVLMLCRRGIGIGRFPGRSLPVHSDLLFEAAGCILGLKPTASSPPSLRDGAAQCRIRQCIQLNAVLVTHCSTHVHLYFHHCLHVFTAYMFMYSLHVFSACKYHVHRLPQPID